MPTIQTREYKEVKGKLHIKIKPAKTPREMLPNSKVRVFKKWKKEKREKKEKKKGGK